MRKFQEKKISFVHFIEIDVTAEIWSMETIKIRVFVEHRKST